ncbi:kelch repeat-containing protein [Pontibacter sp. 13R65]|uniref:kelch repeat-containing protein n=1 Tax=Pontibacter sp. 13R65 TaxID=3127458 RepID=UPI00301C3ED4
MSKNTTPIFNHSVPAGWVWSVLLTVVLLGNFSAKGLAQGCPPISTLPCAGLEVSLPYSLNFSSSIAGTLADKNGVGTGFTLADAYSGTRLAADGSPTNTTAPGYEPSKLTVASGRLQVITNQGIASTTSNNQLNALGVKVNSRTKITAEVNLINPFNGTAFQQGGLWFGLNDKTFVKLVVVGNKVEMRREMNDVSTTADQRITGSVTGINTSTVRLKLVIDPDANTATGFFTLNDGAERSVGAALSISGMGLTASTANVGIFATHRNGSTPITYTFDDFSVTGNTTSGGNAPVFVNKNYTFSVSDGANVGTTAGTVKATDPDGDVITYSITAGNTNGAFGINPATGAITLAKKLNYHTQSAYSLKIRASDAGAAFDVATATINVTAENTLQPYNSITWSTVASQPYSVNEAQGKVVNGKLYTFGGFDSRKSCCTPTSRAYVYDPVTNRWTPIAPMPAMNGTNYGGVTHAGFTTDGTDIYFAGGYTSNAAGTGQIFGTREAWKYIVAENRYVRLPDLPIVISAGQLEYLNGKLHHIAGTNQARTQDLGNHYVLDLDNLAAGWTTLSALPNPRQHAGSAVFNEKIYFIGGQNGHDHNLVASKEVHRYDPVTNTWTKVADLPVPTGATGRGHISSSVTIAGDRVLVLGGETVHNSSRTNMVSAYNPATNTWSNLTSLPSSRYSGVAGFINNLIYYTGGSNSSTTFKGTPGGTTTTQQQVVSFSLFNADSKSFLQSLSDGATLNLSTFPTKNFNIRANTNPTTVGSVILELSGAQTETIIENRAPYDLMGDNGVWVPTVGNYTLKATPYSSSNGSGSTGTPLTINFSVTNETTITSKNLINSGGNQYIDQQARNWTADSYFTGGLTRSKIFDVAGTTEDPLYQYYRYADNTAPFSYNIPFSGTGPCNVYLHFLEPYFGAPGGKTTNLTGARVFHVDIEGQRVLENYDIYTQDGAGKAIVKMFHIESVSDGIINIVFTSVKDNAIISAIEVEASPVHAASSTIEVYPNPSNGDKIHVALKGFIGQEHVSLTLYDLAGRAIQTTSANTDQNGTSVSEIPISRELNRGLYIIKAQSNLKEVRTKIFID